MIRFTDIAVGGGFLFRDSRCTKVNPYRVRGEMRNAIDENGAAIWVNYDAQVERCDLNTADYRLAPGGEGPLAATWRDKPHRLIYDLCAEIERLRLELDILDENRQ